MIDPAVSERAAAPKQESAGPQPCGPPRFQVLALDGGGAKALFTAHVLERLEEDLGGVRIVDSFDLIAGTSAGGIIALALGAGIGPAEIVKHYSRLTEQVFPRPHLGRWRYLSHPFRSAYSAKVLKRALGGVLGDQLLGHSAKRLLIPSWDVQRGQVHVFKTPHHERLKRDWRVPMVDVALATTAAPTYFPAAKTDGQRLVDGGVWANNPSVLAIAESVSMLEVPLKQIRVLNVGAVDQRTTHSRRLDRGGWATWAIRAANFVITASSRGAQGTAMHLVGQENFHRFDAEVPGNIFTLDRADPTELAGLAAGMSRMLSPIYSDRFADHVAAPYVPIYGPDASQAL